MTTRQRTGHGNRGRGRGAYYAAKYGNRGSRDSNASSDSVGGTTNTPSSSNFPRQNSYHSSFTRNDSRGGDVAVPLHENGNLTELSNFLKSVDNSPYPNFKPLKGTWRLSETMHLIFDQIQGDAYASPSRARIRVPLSETGFPDFLFSSPVRVIAFCDYITRKFVHFSTVSRLDYKRTAKGWSSAKGGHVSIDAPGQHVLPRTSCVIDDDGRDGKVLELRFFVSLPARGRTIEGHVADESLTQILPIVAEKAMYSQGDDAERCSAHVRCVDEQEELRSKLPSMGLVAFIAEGAILPRAGGDTDIPMECEKAIKFRTPDSLAVETRLSTGRKLKGMGLKPGVTLIVGGGFHGKSTLLSALQLGVYNHAPEDGRNFVVVVPESISIRAEDGRYVVGVDISPFIGNLPFGKRTESFSTVDASGSTSQAANIIEGIDAGAKLLLIDEDLSATNFMMRDARMQKLVPKQKEPITPMIQRIRSLYEQRGVSCILVVGGCGDYFEVSDTVVMMDSYCPTDVTEKAKNIASEYPSGIDGIKKKNNVSGENEQVMTVGKKEVFKNRSNRKMSTESLRRIMNGGKGKVFAKTTQAVEVGNEKIDLSAISQLVETSQTKAIAAALERLSEMPELEAKGVTECVSKLFQLIDRDGLDVINVRGERMGNYSRPRPFEVHAALNRLRGLQVAEP